jgi:hypothetical protein
MACLPYVIWLEMGAPIMCINKVSVNPSPAEIDRPAVKYACPRTLLVFPDHQQAGCSCKLNEQVSAGNSPFGRTWNILNAP